MVEQNEQARDFEKGNHEEHLDHMNIYNEWTKMDLSIAVNSMAGFILQFFNYQHNSENRTKVLDEIYEYIKHPI